MNFSPTSHHRTARGFTIIELLVVIAIIVLIAALLIPALGKAYRSAMSAEDKTQARGIHSAMMLFSTGNEGKFPRPSLVAADHDTQHDTSDTTANLMSFMIAQNYFKTDHLISPVEANPNITDMNVHAEVDAGDDHEHYDFDSIGSTNDQGEIVLWDDQFMCDIEVASVTDPANNSYAHQALCGQRIRLKWHSGASSSDIIISNRGPRDGDVGTTGDAESYTLKFHTSADSWAGNIVLGDGSSRFVSSVFPDGIAYQPLNGSPLGPDNIFNRDWNDVIVGGIDDGSLSGDNWMVICNQITGEVAGDGKTYDVVNAVWD
jgi:prepilin-type N-terminal cleavage/methylation domain-containing protein